MPRGKACAFFVLMCMLCNGLHAQCLRDLTDSKPIFVTNNNESPSNPAWNCLKNIADAGVGWETLSDPEPGAPVWITVWFTAGAEVIKGYSITSMDDWSNNLNRAPRDWTLEGSNDGTSFVVLDTKNNQAFTAPGETRIFAISNTAAYSYYRLQVTQTFNTGATLGIAAVQLFEQVCLTGTVFKDNGDGNAVYNSSNDVPLPGVVVK